MNFSTKITFKYSAFDSLKQAKRFFTIVFDYQKLQAFLFPLPIISEYTLVNSTKGEKILNLFVAFYLTMLTQIYLHPQKLALKIALLNQQKQNTKPN